MKGYVKATVQSNIINSGNIQILSAGSFQKISLRSIKMISRGHTYTYCRSIKRNQHKSSCCAFYKR